MNIFRKIRASLRLREAVRQADEKHKETGERYYVMPAGGKKGQLIIMDRKNFRKLKQKGYINHNTFVGDLERECFYCTTYGNGSAMLPSAVIALKRKQYFSWLDSFSNTKENGNGDYASIIGSLVRSRNWIFRMKPVLLISTMERKMSG